MKKPVFGSIHYGGTEGMFAGALETCRQSEHFVFLSGLEGGNCSKLRLAFGQRAGLVDDKGIDLFERLKGFSIFDQNTGVRATTGAHHDRHRRSQSESARASDNQDGYGIDHCVGETRLRTEEQTTRRT